MHMYYVHAWCLHSQKRASDCLELESQTVGSDCHVGAGNCTQFSISTAIVLTH